MMSVVGSGAAAEASVGAGRCGQAGGSGRGCGGEHGFIGALVHWCAGVHCLY